MYDADAGLWGDDERSFVCVEYVYPTTSMSREMSSYVKASAEESEVLDVGDGGDGCDLGTILIGIRREEE